MISFVKSAIIELKNNSIVFSIFIFLIAVFSSITVSFLMFTINVKNKFDKLLFENSSEIWIKVYDVNENSFDLFSEYFFEFEDNSLTSSIHFDGESLEGYEVNYVNDNLEKYQVKLNKEFIYSSITFNIDGNDYIFEKASDSIEGIDISFSLEFHKEYSTDSTDSSYDISIKTTNKRSYNLYQIIKNNSFQFDDQYGLMEMYNFTNLSNIIFASISAVFFLITIVVSLNFMSIITLKRASNYNMLKAIGYQNKHLILIYTLISLSIFIASSIITFALSVLTNSLLGIMSASYLNEKNNIYLLLYSLLICSFCLLFNILYCLLYFRKNKQINIGGDE